MTLRQIFILFCCLLVAGIAAVEAKVTPMSKADTIRKADAIAIVTIAGVQTVGFALSSNTDELKRQMAAHHAEQKSRSLVEQMMPHQPPKWSRIASANVDLVIEGSSLQAGYPISLLCGSYCPGGDERLGATSGALLEKGKRYLVFLSGKGATDTYQSVNWHCGYREITNNQVAWRNSDNRNDSWWPLGSVSLNDALNEVRQERSTCSAGRSYH
jgi:hypothetical protein